MTLRVTISIVPHGNEDGERIIETINISNLGPSGRDYYNYGIEVDKYKTRSYDAFVDHDRGDGARKLVQLVLAELENNG